MNELYLFSWEKIPGKNNKLIKKYLDKNYNIYWAEKAKIVKISDGKVIRVFDDKNYLSLSLNDDKTKAYLKINGNKIDEFIVKLEDGMLNIYKSDTYYDKVDKAERFEQIRNIEPNFYPSSIPEEVPENPKKAYIIQRIALYLNDETFKYQAQWENYWFRCCISEKCDYIFLILKSRNINREDDLLKICNPESKLWKEVGDVRIKINVDLCIDFFLRRYNWIGAAGLCWNYPTSKVHSNWIKLFFPRMLAGVLVGFLPIVASQDLRNFTENTPLNLKICIGVIVFFGIILYFLFECNKTTQKTLGIKKLSLRVFSVFTVSSIAAIFISTIFSYVGLLGTGDWNLSIKVIFYAMIALFIGILVQLLWEEKTATEPL